MKPRPWMFTTLAALAVMGCSDTASAQPQLTVMPATTAANPLVFNNIPAGGLSKSQTVTVGTADSSSPTVTILVNPASPWIQVTPNTSVNLPATLSVQANTVNLASGTYNGSFTINVSGASVPDQVTVYVSLTVTGISALSANPTGLAFSAQAGATAGSPASAQVQIASNTGPLNYTLQVNYLAPAGNWLLLSTTQGSTAGPPLTVSVNPSVIAATQYPATFNANLVATSTSSADSVVIGVQLTINSNASVSVTPTNPPPFLFQSGASTDPAAQQLTISSTGGSTTYSVQENPPVSWLVVSPLGGTASATPSTITLNATPKEQALQPGTYNTTVVVTPGGAVALPPIPVSLVVAAHPLLRLSNNSLSFTAPFGGNPSPAQTVIVSSSGSGQIGFNVSTNQSWLTASASANTTPATVTIQVVPASLNIQSYTGTVTITPTNGDNYTETITVNLNVISPSQLVAGPDALLFSYQIGKAPAPSQAVEISSTGDPLAFNLSLATSSCGSNWLNASPIAGSSTSTITIGVVTTGLAAGTCSGTVNVNFQSGTGPAVLAIPVTLAISNSAELSVNMIPNFGVATIPLGSNPFDEQISLTSTDPTTQVDFTANVMNVSGGAWLGIAGSNVGITPQNLTIQISPNVLSIPGVYSGTVVISSSTLGTAQLTLQVNLTVTTSTTVTITPSALTFTEPQGGAAPAAQTLTLAASGTATYTAVIASINGGNWLQISPTSGSASSPMQVTVLPNTLSQGQYTAQIAFAFQNSATTAQNVNVTLNVTAAQTITVSPTALSFNYQIGSTAPGSQSLSITANSGSPTVALSTTSSGWLSVNSTGGATPQTITVSVNPQGLLAQTYNGSISITAPGVLATPISVPVSFTIAAAPGPVPITIINNATGVSGVIAPGEEIAIKGNFLGPATPASGTLFSLNSSGGVNNSLAGVQVLFDNNPGTPIYVSASQINVVVPYEINGRLSTSMVVQYAGGSSQPFQLSVAASAPGLFTNNFSGSGQVAAINQNFSANGASGGFQAAPRGTVIALYGTGGGQTNPPSVTGSVTPIPTNASQLLTIPNVTATVGGLPATVNFAGSAPGLVTGVFQVNVTIPAGVTPGGAVPVTISIGSNSTPIGTTIAVQ